jgi:hypothetical protein
MGCIKSLICSVTAITLLISTGCSLRPENRTVELSGNLSSADSSGVFELKGLNAFKCSDESLAGWMGNELITYDKNGIYLANYKTSAYDNFVSLASGQSIAQSPVLSGNGKKLLYSITDAQGAVKWYITDSDSITSEFDLSGATGLTVRNFSWSSKGNYIYSQAAGNSFYLFDVSSQPTGYQKIRVSNLISVFDINEDGSKFLVSLFQNSADQSPALCIAGASGSVSQVLENNSLALKASFLGSDTVAILSGSYFTVIKADQTRKQSYGDVRDFALSADKNYICILKAGAGDTTDVYVGSVKNGLVSNLSLIYVGYEATPKEIFFSQDDKRVALRGYQKSPQKQGSVSYDSEITIFTFQ